MSDIIRILHIINGMGSGGAEMVIMNWYRHIDRNRVQFDFLLRSKVNIYADEISKLGGRVYYVPSFPRHLLENYIVTEEFLEKHTEYKIIHVHGNALIYMTVLELGKKKNIPCRIMHSHNTKAARSIYNFVHYFNKRRIENLATDYFACSKDAGHWMFGKQKFKIIKNAIDINKFSYNNTIRKNYRKGLNIENKFVIGNVARFLPSKNHSFLLDIFKKILEKDEDSVLLLIGEGRTKLEIRKKAEQLEIQDRVIFLGRRNDVNHLMQAMDVFIFPSFYEGLGVTLIEAQTSGLPCIASDTIPKESNITGNIQYLSLKLNEKYWAEKVYCLKQNKRKDASNRVKQSGYDIKSVALDIQNFYLKKYKESTKS